MLEDNPQLVNQEAEKTWIFEAKLSEEKELDALMDKAQYDEFLKKQNPH
jgi:glycine cleavage system H lipoate-binding protein